MFSQYMDGTFHPVNGSPQPKAHQQPTDKKAQKAAKPNALLGEFSEHISRLIGGFSLAQLDTGDILLVLIILFLFLEGDNLELVITLGLMLLLSFNDD